MLNFLGVVKAAQLRRYRTCVIFGTFVFGAVATPSTDPFSMLALALPMAALLAAELVSHIHDRRLARKLAGRSGSVPTASRILPCAAVEHDEPDART